jgi:hypothetical protein
VNVSSAPPVQIESGLFSVLPQIILGQFNLIWGNGDFTLWILNVRMWSCLMKPGDLIRFKKSDKVGTIVSVKVGEHWTEVKVLHGVEGIPNPTGFTLRNLLETAEVISERR